MPGDANTLHWKGKPIPNTAENRNRADLDYTGSVMPPPEAVAGTYAHPEARGYGWMCDDNRPTLTLTSPRVGANGPLTRLLVGMHDYYTGLDRDSFRVVADFPVDGVAAGENLATRFQPKTPGVWELRLAQPIGTLPAGKITVSVNDRQGNVSRIERSFAIVTKAATR